MKKETSAMQDVPKENAVNANRLIARYEELLQAAKDSQMDIDLEKAELVPRKLQNMTYLQRDQWVKNMERRQYYKDLNDKKDNDAAAPEQAGWDGYKEEEGDEL